jgi:hypothetical protein
MLIPPACSPLAVLSTSLYLPVCVGRENLFWWRESDKYYHGHFLSFSFEHDKKLSRADECRCTTTTTTTTTTGVL